MQKFDYIITGTGASGLMLAYHLLSDPYFEQTQLLLIDKDVKDQNDRTWCFWEKGNGIWDEILHKKWSHIYFGSDGYSKKINIAPYYYKMIRSKDFYDFVLKTIRDKTNVTIVQDNVKAIHDERNRVVVHTDQTMYEAAKVFNSIVFSSAYKEQEKYPVLNQHFLGWFLKTETAVFDVETATFMDFTVAQKGNTRFMYVLPISEYEALVEYTLFSEDLLPENEYESAIQEYIKEKGVSQYDIVEKEKGCIPMTCYDFRTQNSENVIHMGTAGGWTKPSTGYTFGITSKKVRKLTQYIKKNADLSKFEKRTKFWYYDLLLLDVLYQKNYLGASLFQKLFKRNDSRKILKFLDEETTFLEDIRITTSLPSLVFLKALWNRVFHRV